MKPEQALEIVTNAIQTEHMTTDQEKALSIVKKAVEKLIPRRPRLDKMDGFEIEVAAHLCCPSCGKSVINYWSKSVNPPHCMICGQALDWTESKDDVQ